MNKKCLEEHVIHGTSEFPVGIYPFDTNDDPLIPLHYHKEFEFLVLTKGKANVQLENTSISLNQLEGVFINSETLHSSVNLENSTCSFIAIVFSPKFIALEDDNLYKNLIRPIMKNELVFPLALPNKVISIAMETNALFHTANLGYELAVKGNIARMLSICIANAEKRFDVKHDTQSETVKKVLDYIHLNYGGTITLYDLSVQAHTSKEHLCRIFREASGVSPIVYLNRYRIMQSAYMLRSTNKSISEISFCCGFNSSSYFNKTFMRFMKCTPSEYRRSLY